MKKIYSLLLMAATLLVGTNANASFTYTLGGVSQDVTSKTLYDVFTEVLGTENAVAVITLGSEETLAPAPTSEDPTRLKFNNGQNITLDLNGHGLVDGLRIDVINAKLRVINSGAEAVIDATNCNGNGSQAFNTYGVSETNPEVARDACYFLLGEKVVLNVKSYGVAVMYYGAFAGTSVNGRPTYGSTTEIKGKINASEGTGIATNGTMSFATGDKSKCPIVNIYPTAVITGSNALEEIVGHAAGTGEEKAVYAKVGEGNVYKTTEAAVYGPGYAEWNIQGTLYGGVGLYLKSGKYNIDNAKIYATAAEYFEPIAYGNGFIGAGSAIVFDKNAAYGGNIEMTIGGAETEVHSNTGYAIEDTHTTNTGTPAEAETAVIGIEIKDGDFESNAGDVIATTPALQEQIIENGSITGGTYSEGIAEYLDPTAVATVDAGIGKISIKVAVQVTPNDYGYSTFSAKKNVTVPAGVVAYKATGLTGGEESKLIPAIVAEAGQVIPANTGVILVCDAADQVTFEETSDAAAGNFDGNLIKAATAFDAAREAEALVYILHGNELWLYTGETFPANKAFFLLPGGSSAPARIRLAFEEAQGVENVEAAFKAEKFVENGQVLIKRGEAIYNVQGQIVK